MEIVFGPYFGTLEIVAPHIQYLKLIGSLEPCTLVDVSSLTDANFSLNYVGKTTRGDGFHQDMVLKMLQKLQNVENLTIGPIVLQVIFSTLSGLVAESAHIGKNSFRCGILILSLSFVSFYLLPSFVVFLFPNSRLNL